MSASKGIFITCEGGEGVGKSSFLELLLREIKQHGISVVGTREPGGSPLGEAIRTIFNHPPEEDPLTPEAEFFLVSAARAQHLAKKIQPQLQAGTWVVCDRFTDSSLVYQGVLGGLTRTFLDIVNLHSTHGVEVHTTFLLDCPVDISLARVKTRNLGQDTRFDKADHAYHVKIREAFLKLADEFPNRYVVLDAQLSTKELVETAIRKLEERSAFKKQAHYQSLKDKM